MTKKDLSIIAACCLLASPAVAEDKTEQKQNLDECVVTATRTSKSITDAPGSVSIVTKDEIKKRNIQSVDQALSLVPGLYNTGGKGIMASSYSINLRSIPGQGRTLFLLDGIPMNDANSGGVQSGSLNPDDVQKIEIVRGPSSSLFGGSAMGGVINVLTLMPDKREVTFSGGYGDGHPRGDGLSHLWSTRGSFGDKIGKLRLYTALSYKSTDGFPTTQSIVSTAPPATLTGWTATTDTKGAKRYLIGDRGNNTWLDYSATARAQYDFTDNANIRVSYLRSYFKYDYEEPNTYLKNAAGTPVFSYTGVPESTFLGGQGARYQDIYSISSDVPLGPVKAKLLFSYADRSTDYITPTSGTTGAKVNGTGPGSYSESPNTSYYTDLQVSLPVLDKHLLTGGVSFRHDTLDSTETKVTSWKDTNSKTGAPTYWAGGKSTTYSAYIQAEIALLDNLTLYVGGRDDYWTSSDGYAGQTGAGSFSSRYPEKSQNAFSPKGALVWRPAGCGTTVRISGGKAFRAPSIYQNYRTWTSVSGSTTTIYNANPDLKPEIALSWDAGVEQELWDGAKAKATYFENNLSDLIYSVSTGSVTSGGLTTNTKLNSNVGGAVSRGVELEFEQKVNKNLRLFSAYTYSDSYITSNPAVPALVGKSMVSVPRHVINGGVDASYGPLSVFFSGRYVSKVFNTDDNSDVVGNVYGADDAYFVADMKTSFKLSDWATVSISVDNLLGREYYASSVATGRSWFANLALKF